MRNISRGKLLKQILRELGSIRLLLTFKPSNLESAMSIWLLAWSSFQHVLESENEFAEEVVLAKYFTASDFEKFTLVAEKIKQNALQELSKTQVLQLTESLELYVRQAYKVDSNCRISKHYLISMALCFLVAILFFVWLYYPSQKGWQVLYYQNEDLTNGVRAYFSQKEVSLSENINKISRTPFSASFKGCLKLDRPLHNALFFLTSDDGSRLFADGKLVLDNWGKHGTRTVQTKITLLAGVHSLKIEYNNLLQDAVLNFVSQPRWVLDEIYQPDTLGECH